MERQYKTVVQGEASESDDDEEEEQVNVLCSAVVVLVLWSESETRLCASCIVVHTNYCVCFVWTPTKRADASFRVFKTGQGPVIKLCVTSGNSVFPFFTLVNRREISQVTMVVEPTENQRLHSSNASDGIYGLECRPCVG